MMSMDGGENLGTAYGKVVIDPSGVSSGMNQARRVFRDNIDSMTGLARGFGNTFKEIGSNLTAMTAPIAAFGASGLKAAADFDSSMTEISARTGLMGEELEKVSALALQLGADTVFSSQQAADAFLQLLTAGMSVEDAIATLPSVLDAAAASGEDLGRSADLVTNIMSSFQLEASESARIVDLLSKAAASSPASMAQIGEAMQDIGGQATAMGISIEDTSAILAIFAQNGIRGAEAGTQLRSMLRMMTRDTPDVVSAWQELGTSLFDANGEMRDLDTVFQEIDAALATKTPEEANRIINELAGSYGMAGFNALRAGVSIDEMKKRMASQTDATEVAQARMDTFTGAVTSLMGSIQTLQIQALTPFMNETLKPLVQTMIENVNAVTAWAQANPELTKTIVKWLSILVLVGPTLLGLGLAITSVVGILSGFGTLIALTLSPLSLLIGAVGGLAYAFHKDIGGIRSTVQPVFDYLFNAIGNLYDVLKFFVADIKNFGLAEALKGIFGKGTIADTMESSLEGFLFTLGVSRDRAISIVNGLWSGINTVFNGIANTVSRVTNALKPLFAELFEFFSNIFGKVDFKKVYEIGSTLLSLTNPIGLVMTAARAMKIDLVGVFEDIAGALTRFFATINDGGNVFDGLRGALGKSGFIDAIEDGFGDVIKFITKKVMPALESLADWFIKDALPDIVDFIQDTVFPAILNFGRIVANIWGVVAPALMQFARWFIDDALPAIVDFVRNSVIPAFQSFIGFLANIWSVVGPSLKMYADWFLQDAMPAIVTLIKDSVIPAIKEFVGYMVDIWNAVAPALGQLATWFLQDAMPAILSFISDAVIPGIGVLVDTFRAIWSLVYPYLTKLLGWFLEIGMPVIIDFLNSTVIPAIETLTSTFSDIWNVASPFLQNLIDWFQSTGWPIIGNLIRDVIVPGVQLAVDIFSDIWRIASPFLTNLVDWFVTTGWPIIQGIIDTVLNPSIESITTLLSNIWTTAEPFLNDLKTGLDTIFGGIKTYIIDPLIEAINAIVGAFEDAYNAAVGIAGDIGNLLDDLNPTTGSGFLADVPIIGQGSGTGSSMIMDSIAAGWAGYTDAQKQEIAGRMNMTIQQMEQYLASRDSGGPGEAGTGYRIGRGQQGFEAFIPGENGSFYPDFVRNLSGIMSGMMQKYGADMRRIMVAVAQPQAYGDPSIVDTARVQVTGPSKDKGQCVQIDNITIYANDRAGGQAAADGFVDSLQKKFQRKGLLPV